MISSSHILDALESLGGTDGRSQVSDSLGTQRAVVEPAAHV